MSTKENNEVVVEKIENDKDAKCEIKGTKRSAEDKTDDVKKARKEENGADSEGEELEEEEEEGADCEEDDEEELPEGDEEELEGEEDDEEDVEGEEGVVEEEEEDA